MNAARSRRQWWWFVLLILALQVILIFSLSDKNTTVPPRRPWHGPSLNLLETSGGDLFALHDPTLFALPHARGFSGKAWQLSPRLPVRSFEWTDNVEWLPLPVSHLGQGLTRFLQVPPAEAVAAPADPQFVQPEGFLAQPLAQKSFVRIEGALRHRKLLAPIQPSSWPHGDLLTNTVIELLVGPDGRPFSLRRLPPGSGSGQADQQAIALARSARFESIVTEGPRSTPTSAATTNSTSGTMVFVWHTLPSTSSSP